MSDEQDIVRRLRRMDARSEEALREAFQAMLDAADEIERLRAELAAEREQWGRVQRDHDRLVRELDAALNGADRAAPQASLCDIVSQVSNEIGPLRADAERYRALRTPHDLYWPLAIWDRWHPENKWRYQPYEVIGSDLDAAVDAAIDAARVESDSTWSNP